MVGVWESESGLVKMNGGKVLEKSMDLVDKLFGLWISGKLMVNFVTSVHYAGVIPTA